MIVVLVIAAWIFQPRVTSMANDYVSIAATTAADTEITQKVPPMIDSALAAKNFATEADVDQKVAALGQKASADLTEAAKQFAAREDASDQRQAALEAAAKAASDKADQNAAAVASLTAKQSGDEAAATTLASQVNDLSTKLDAVKAAMPAPQAAAPQPDASSSTPPATTDDTLASPPKDPHERMVWWLDRLSAKCHLDAKDQEAFNADNLDKVSDEQLESFYDSCQTNAEVAAQNSRPTSAITSPTADEAAVFAKFSGLYANDP
ncbi:MAG TPA: hypothetical protein VG753_02845 [Candidatus Paceibacterota bacterium]|nr:hypothetical protein [Candidatus Paceibacterota bacterium]